ncbi:MAG: amidohydrolase [Bacillota bacterium]|nr:amidohydrolase [Bacillota bacterium]
MKDISSLRRDFHKIAEPGWMEVQTTIKIIKYLKDLGFQVYYGKNIHGQRLGLPDPEFFSAYVASLKFEDINFNIEEILQGYTGCIGVFDTGRPGPTTALRADIDALTVSESKDPNHRPNKEGFTSTNDFASHCCGHDGHIAIGLKTCQEILARADQLSGKFIVIFQPAEEGVRGALSMKDLEILDQIDYFLGSHLGMGLESGLIGLGTENFLAYQSYDIDLFGRASHAGMAPDQGRSAILGAAALTLGLHSLSQYQSTTRLNVGVLKGGSGRNVLPSQASLQVEIRADDNTAIADLAQRLKAMVQGTAAAYELTYQLLGQGYAQGYTTKNPDFVDSSASYLKNKGYKLLLRPNFNASEDVSIFLNKVEENGGKALHFIFGSELKGSHHQEDFDFDETSLSLAVEVYMAMIEKFNGIKNQ